MPIYEYKHCGIELELYQTIGSEPPKCEKCGDIMNKKFSIPSLLRTKTNGIIPRSKGYKEGYSKEYLKDNPSAQELS